MTSRHQGKPNPGDRVGRGVPSWLTTSGVIIFGGRRPVRSPDVSLITVADTEQVPEKNSAVNERGPSDTKERTPDP